MEEVLVGSDRAVKYLAVDDEGTKVTGATVSCELIDPTGAVTTPAATNTSSNIYRAICRSAIKGTYRAIITITSSTHVGRAREEWRAIDPKETP